MKFTEFISSQSPLVADGSITTSLYEKGFYINRSFEELSVTEPTAVKEVTQAFKQAGAKLLSTNTFSALHTKLLKYGLQDDLEKIIEAACDIAKSVRGDGDEWVVGVMGPMGVLLEPLGPTSIEEAKDVFSRSATALAKNQADVISLLGFHDLKELEMAIVACKESTSLPLMIHMAIQESMKSSYGHSLHELAQLADKFDVEVVGLSGEVGPSGMLTAVNSLRKLTQRPISVLPNAGLPRFVNDEYIYLCNPDYLGKFSARLAKAGAQIIGGHSGVHDTHIKAVSNALRMLSCSDQSKEMRAGTPSVEVRESSHLQPIIDTPKSVVGLDKRSLLGTKLTQGQKVVSVEILPPKGIDLGKFLSHCKELEEAKVEFVNIPDGARAMARMSSLQMASFVKSRFNLEPIPHFTSRDRNLIGLQSDLLGCHINGIRNVLLVTGDPPKLGNCPGATAVYDVDAIGMTHIAARMNKGLDLGGSSFGSPTEFAIGVALNPTSAQPDQEAKRFGYKIEAGADYAITQPIYDIDAYSRFMDQMKGRSIPVIMGIWPLVSLRNAEFLKNEVPGVSVPDWVVTEMEKANGDPDESLKRGLDIAIKTMEQAAPLVQGFQVSAPFNRVAVAVEAIWGALGKPQ